MPPSNYVGSFWTRATAARSVRQKFLTGPQYYKRRSFRFDKGHHVLQRRIMGDPTAQAEGSHRLPEWARHRHLPGDVRTAPEEDFTLSYDHHVGERRVDKAVAKWQKRGRLQVWHIGGRAETFVCYRCGYPTKSRLQVIKDENWDWRMCYNCYTTVVKNGQENDV